MTGYIKIECDKLGYINKKAPKRYVPIELNMKIRNLSEAFYQYKLILKLIDIQLDNEEESKISDILGQQTPYYDILCACFINMACKNQEGLPYDYINCTSYYKAFIKTTNMRSAKRIS